MLKIKLIFYIICFGLANLLSAQTSQIRFKRLTINDGLSLSSVYCIYQDSKGFMWIGTEDGLNRFDGKNFKIFRDNPDQQNSLAYKWIDQIYEDRSGMLWFSSRNGLTSYNPEIELFTKYRNNVSDATSLTNDTTTVIFEDSSSQLWIGTKAGINRIDRNNKKISKFTVKNSKLKVFSSRINTILEDENNMIWIACDAGLYSYEKRTNKIDQIIFNLPGCENIQCNYMVVKKNKLWIGTNCSLICYDIKGHSTQQFHIKGDNLNFTPDQTIQSLCIDSQNRFWINTVQGLFQFDETQQIFKLLIVSTDQSNSQAINPIKPICEDRNGNIWYGTFGEGLYKISSSGNIINYRNNPSVPTSLSYNSIHSIYEDGSGAIWLGTFGAGICIYIPQAHKFDLITSSPNEANSLSSNFIWTILDAKDGTLWVGTNKNGISRYFTVTGTYIHYNYDENIPGSLSNSTVRFLFQDRDGDIWIATDGGGLNKFIPETGKFKVYKHNPNYLNTISDNNVRGIIEDNEGRLWIGTRQGLNCFDKRNGTFQNFRYSANDTGSLSNNYVYTGIFQDRKGNLWIGTMGGGLNKMDISTGRFKAFMYNPLIENCIADKRVFCIYEDKLGMLWIGTNSGLNRFDPITEKFQRFGLKEGLPNEVIYGILPDEDNNIWLSTNLGICRFNLSNYKTTNFDVSDGLQSNEFNGGAFHKGKNGLLYFAGVNGLNVVNPKKLAISEDNYKVIISKLEIFGQETKVDATLMETESEKKNNLVIELDGNYYLHKNISYSNEIALNYPNNFLSIEFAALNTAIPEKVQYAYMMMNLDKDWNYSGNRNFVSYARIKPGCYIFKVKAKNSDGTWSKSIAELKITINPPFWETWWFISIEFLVFSFIILFIYRYLLNRKTNKLLQAQNEQITLANKQLSESEQNLKQLNATKDKFFSIVSHDLKNPFSSLLSMASSVSEYFDSIDEEDKRTVFKKINESLKQIHILLNNLLTWSRSQSGKIEFNPVIFPLADVIDSNVDLHKLVAEKKGVKLISNQDKNLKVYADKEMINAVIRNLIDNALKYTGKGNSIVISAKKSDSFVNVSVKDDGLGISDENIKKLFRIDVKYKQEGTSGEKGTGLGLILCKEFVEKNNGKIKVESKLGQGSVFSFSIPAI